MVSLSSANLLSSMNFATHFTRIPISYSGLLLFITLTKKFQVIFVRKPALLRVAKSQSKFNLLQNYLQFKSAVCLAILAYILKLSTPNRRQPEDHSVFLELRLTCNINYTR
jgi:hypothetical protein